MLLLNYSNENDIRQTMDNYIFDTITAISTPMGQGGIGIIKISGDKALSIANRLFKNPNKKLIRESHKIYYGKIVDPSTDEMVDEVLVIYMKKPKSYTGEDVIEIQCHGGHYVTKKILSLCVIYGARIAENGEFTKRAFINGRLDLTQAEAITDLINSKISSSLNIACKQLEGKLSLPIKGMREELVNLLAQIEVCIDFPEDVEEVSKNDIKTDIEKISEKIEKLLQTADAGRIYRDGVAIAIIGRTNVGKSSLLNKLINYERAIVTDIPGTTRDTIEEYVNLNNIPVKLIDTAGIRDTENLVEQIGVERTYSTLEEADLVLIVVEADKGMLEEEIKIIRNLNKPFIVIANKMDLLEGLQTFSISSDIAFTKISAKFGEGITELENMISRKILDSIDLSDNVPVNSRHKGLLYKSGESLARVINTIENNLPIDFIPIDLKDAIVMLGEITGDDVTEEVIDNIFNNFCVGK